MKKFLIMGNWKMNKISSDAKEYFKILLGDIDMVTNVDVVVCPPATLVSLSKSIAGKVMIGGQNCYIKSSGAYTGEISPEMLKDLGADFCLVGHSERRGVFGETDELVNQKLKAVLKAGLTPVLCVGENWEERKNKETEIVISTQLTGSLADIDKATLLRCVLAYEPVWAISGGDASHAAATPEDAENAHAYIRGLLTKMYDTDTAKTLRIIYGGSMKPENAEGLLSQPDIDGGLPGTASLSPEKFGKIVQIASKLSS